MLNLPSIEHFAPPALFSWSDIGDPIYIQWNEFVHLFGTLETLNVLNTTAPGFTSVIHETMWEALILHICCLTDPVKVSGKDTLTLERLPPLVDPTIHPLVKQRLDTYWAGNRMTSFHPSSRSRRKCRVAGSRQAVARGCWYDAERPAWMDVHLLRGEARWKHRLVHPIQSPLTQFVFTSRERATVVNELLAESAKYVTRGDYVLAYDEMPMFYDLTHTRNGTPTASRGRTARSRSG